MWCLEAERPPYTLQRKLSQDRREAPRRSTLAQLRLGYSKYLNAYLVRINNEVTPDCPLCTNEPHNTPYNFECTTRTTHLAPLLLWTNPVEVATLLALDEEDNIFT